MPFRVLPVLVLVAVVLTGVFLPRPGSVGDPDVIRIVSSLPRTGSARGQTNTIVEGIQLALHEIDHKVVLGGKTYRIDYLDLDDATAAAGQWTAEAEISNAQLAVRDPNVMVYIGTYNSGAAKISMPILNKADLLMISPANTAEGLTKPGLGDRAEPMCYRPTGRVNYLRVVPTDDLQGALGANWAQDLGCQRVYILDDTEVYGKGIADQFEKQARKIGLDVLGHESIDAKTQEFSALMTKIKQTNPDLIYFGGTTQTKAGQVIKDMVAAGMDKVKMMGPDGCYEKAMIDKTGASFLVDRFYCTFGGPTPDRLLIGDGMKFIQKFKAFHGRAPTEAYAIYGYDCAVVAIEAIRAAGKKDRSAIRAAGIALENLSGATGMKWSFDENGDTTMQLLTGSRVIYTMENGAIKKNANGEPMGEYQFMKDLIPRTK